MKKKAAKSKTTRVKVKVPKEKNSPPVTEKEIRASEAWWRDAYGRLSTAKKAIVPGSREWNQAMRDFVPKGSMSGRVITDEPNMFEVLSVSEMRMLVGMIRRQLRQIEMTLSEMEHRAETLTTV